MRAAAAEPAPRRKVTSFDSAHGQWIHALRAPDGVLSGPASALSRLTDQLREWQHPVTVRAVAPFRLSFRLEEPPPPDEGAGAVSGSTDGGGAWFVRYLLQATSDPSLLVPAEEVWQEQRRARAPLRQAGFEAREHLLASLGQASAIDPDVEKSLRSATPHGYPLDTKGAFEFLSQTSMALEQAGVGVLLPAWWTRKGARSRLTLKAAMKGPTLQGKTGLSLDDLVRFEWQVAVGGVALSLAELKELARLKLPLVRVRGQWVQMSAAEIQGGARVLEEESAGRGARARPRSDLPRGGEDPRRHRLRGSHGHGLGR